MGQSGSIGGVAGASGPAGANGKTAGAAGGNATGSDTASPDVAGDANARAIQAALEKAGIKLQQAGAAISSAQTPEELAKARELLAQARILVIVSSQDLADARQKMGNATGDQAKVLDNAQKSLDNATIALVVANNALLGLPTIDKSPPVTGIATSGSNSDKVRKLDEKLDHSLVVYDGKLAKARQAIQQPGSAPTASAEGGAPTVDKLPDATASTGIGVPGKPKKGGEISTGANSIGSSKMDKKKQGEQVAMQVPEGVGSGQDDDIVAKQLREAAMAETDPKLRKKLWDEYKRYKAGL